MKGLNKSNATKYIKRLETKLEKYNINYNKEVMPRKFEDKVTYYNYLANIYEENTNAIASAQEAKYAENRKEAMNERVEELYEDYLKTILVRYVYDYRKQDLNLYNYAKYGKPYIDRETGEVVEPLGDFPLSGLGWDWTTMFELSGRDYRAQLICTNKRTMAKALKVDEHAIKKLRDKARDEDILKYVGEYSFSNSNNFNRKDNAARKISEAYFVNINELLKALGYKSMPVIKEDEELSEYAKNYYAALKKGEVTSNKKIKESENIKEYSGLPFVQWTKEQWDLVNRPVPESFKVKYIDKEEIEIGNETIEIWTNKRASCQLCAMLNPDKASEYDEIYGRNRMEQDEMLREYFTEGYYSFDIKSAIPRMTKNFLNYHKGEAFIDALDDCYYLINEIMRERSVHKNYQPITREQFQKYYRDEREILKKEVLPAIMKITRIEWLRSLAEGEPEGRTELNKIKSRIMKAKLKEYESVTGIDTDSWLVLLKQAIFKFYDCEGKTYLPSGETFIMESAVYAIIRRKFLELGFKCVCKYDEFFFDRNTVVFKYGIREFEKLFNSVVNSAIKEAMDKAIELEYEAVTPFLKNIKENNK